MIYLDNAATSWPKPDAVLEAWARYHREIAGSPGRGGHRGAVDAERRVERVRADLTDFLGGADARRTILTASCTHALNLAFAGFLRKGDHVVATELDHNSVLRPLRAIERQGLCRLTIAEANRDGFVEAAALEEALRPNTRLVVCTHASNALGTIQDVNVFVEAARRAGAKVLLDAAQTAGAVPIDARRMGLDFVAVPSHKGLLGPSGAGALYVAPGIDLTPTFHGGTGVDSALDVPRIDWPTSFEPGTANPAGIVAWGAGLRHVAETGLDTILARERALVKAAAEGLLPLPGVEIYGTRDVERKTGVLAYNVKGHEPTEIAAVLDGSYGIQVRAGLSCAPRAAAAAGAPPEGAVRASVGPATTPADVAAFVAAMGEIVSSL
jgi:cysteine desulfurase family protein